MKEIRKAFFDHLRESRRLLELVKEGRFANITPPEDIWTFINHVGNFLRWSGAITDVDLDVARGMAEDYEERIGTLLR